MAPLPAVAYRRAAARTVGRRHAGDRFHGLGRIAFLGDEVAPLLEGRHLAALAHEILFDQAFGDDDVGQGIDQRDIGAGPQLQMLLGGNVRRAHQVDAPRIGDDQFRALAQAALHLRGEYRMTVGGIGADDENHVGLHDRVEILRAGRFAQGVLQAVAGGGVAHAGAGVDVVVAEAGAHQFLHEIGLLVGAARGGDAADGVAAVLGLDALQLDGRVADGLLPGHFLPGIGDLRADHGLDDAVRMRGIADGKAALDAGMAVIGVAVHVRHHAHHFLALHLGAERAAHAAIGAGGDDAVLGLTLLDQRLLARASPWGRPARRRRRRRTRSP